MPAATAHIHPGNAGREPLAVRQWIELDAPDPALLRGVERYFETVSALAAQGRVDTLLLSPDKRQWGAFDPESLQAILHAVREPGDEDLVDLAVWMTLKILT